MIREPKNVVTSQLINSPKQKKSVVRLSLLYNKIAGAILKIRNFDNVFVIKYEDLTDKPDLVLKKTFKFLDISYESRIVENVAAPPEIVSEHEFWKHKNIVQDTIQKNYKNKWQQFLTVGQANLINVITAKYAIKFGYELPYNWIGVGRGFAKDVTTLFAWQEFKKIFLKFHKNY